MYVWLVCVGKKYIYTVYIFTIYVYIMSDCIAHCNWAWWLNLCSQTQFCVQSALGVIWFLFFSFKLLLWKYLVNILLESIHIFMLVVYGLYFCWFTSMVLCYSLSVLFVFLWHALDLTTFLWVSFFFVQYQYFTDMHSFKAGVFYV